MNAEQFCYWLQGRAELDTTPPTPEQWKSICEHLATVFVKVTPPVGIVPEIPMEKIFDDYRYIPPKDWRDGVWPPTITCTTHRLTGNDTPTIFMC